jgi:cytochrome c oxidase assembly protein subunit 15
VIALIGVTLALFVLSDLSPETSKRIKYFAVILLAQGLLGYLQYLNGLPELMVGAHLVGSTLVWIAAWRIWLSITTADRK